MYAAKKQEITPAWLRYTVAEEYSGLGRSSLARLVRQREIRAAKLGKHVVIDRQSLDEFLQRHSAA